MKNTNREESKGKPVIDPASFGTLGELLRFLREKEQLSQRQLAAQVGYHFSYISRIEKNQHVPETAVLKARFVPALGLQNQPEWIQRLLELAQGSSADNKEGKSSRQDTLQPNDFGELPISLTSILGREKEIAAVLELLQTPSVRIVSIVGAPGVGKTRLALEVARQSFQLFADGVVFVDLVPAKNTDDVLLAMETSLGVKNQNPGLSLVEKIKNVLQTHQKLIVMDNFEQVLDAATQLTSILRGAPGVKILTTSREALRIESEQEYPLQPLPVGGHSDLDSPVIQLFIERSKAVRPDFRVSSQTLPMVAEICRRLDGLPLAIELSAARVKTLNLNAMINQLNHRFDWLTSGERDLPKWQRSLWSTVEWSYNLLNEGERTLFKRLSVFVGGWTLEAAGAVCQENMEGDVLRLLAGLVDKSLVVADIETSRYHFLETLREFAFEKLKDSDELEMIRQKHFEYFLSFMEPMRPKLIEGGEQVYWLNIVEQDHNNLRQALAWVIEHPDRVTEAMKFGKAMQPFWRLHSYSREARQWLDKILAMDSEPSPIRADLLRFASDYASDQGDYRKAMEYEQGGMIISQMLGDEAGVHYSMDGLALLAGKQGDYAKAVELLEQVLVYRKKVKDTQRLPTTLNNLAFASQHLGNLERAKELYLESIEITRSNGNLRSLSHALLGLADVYKHLNELAPILGLIRECVAIRYQLKDMEGLAASLAVFSAFANQMGFNALAVQMQSVSVKIRQGIEFVVSPAEMAEEKRLEEQLRAKLGDSAFTSAWESGQEMSLDEAVRKVNEATLA